MQARFLSLTALLLYLPVAEGQDILKFPLPDARILNNDQPVTDAATWTLRRPEVSHAHPVRLSSQDPAALNGKAIHKEIILPSRSTAEPVNCPSSSTCPPTQKVQYPSSSGLNFSGNQTVDSDPGISLPSTWQPDPSDLNPIHERRCHIQIQATSATRGAYSYRWQVGKLLACGYGLATAYYGDIEPDFNGGSPLRSAQPLPSRRSK